MEQSASNRYELTWSRFIKELETNPKTTLRAVCKLLHTDSSLLRRWASKHGRSVIKAKAERSMKEFENTSSSTSAVYKIEDKVIM